MSKYYHPGFLLFSLHFPSHIFLWDFASLTWKASGQNQVMFVETVICVFVQQYPGQVPCTMQTSADLTSENYSFCE